jgi:hypothetical protein
MDVLLPFDSLRQLDYGTCRLHARWEALITRPSPWKESCEFMQQRVDVVKMPLPQSDPPQLSTAAVPLMRPNR